MEELEYYEIDKIIDDKIINDFTWYKVKWAGEDSFKNSWVNITDFKNFDSLIEKYNKNKANLKNQEEIDTSENYIIDNNLLSNENFISKAREVQSKNDNYGSYNFADHINKVLHANILNNEIILLVEWKNRINGIKPYNSILYSNELYDNSPYQLIDFYESKLLVKN